MHVLVVVGGDGGVLCPAVTTPAITLSHGPDLDLAIHNIAHNIRHNLAEMVLDDHIRSVVLQIPVKDSL